MANKPKIIVFDLETLPNLGRTMEVFPGMSAYPGRTLKADINSIICFGYKELGKGRAKCINAWDFNERWEEDVNDDYEVVRAANEVLKGADGIITHNGIKFDLKVINTRLIYHGFAPLPKIPHMDTCMAARKRLSLFSNRLDDVAKFLGVEGKMATGGWELWVDVAKRIKRAQRDMAKYCKQDVESLEQVYYELRSLFPHIPNHNVFRGEDAFVCPACGSDSVHKNGFRVTSTRRYQRYICMDCGSHSRVDAKGRTPRGF